MAVLSRDDSVDEYTMLYFDERGVSRTYAMSLKDNLWRLWRSAPGFSQRFLGKIGEGGGSIVGKWELARDEADWKPDLEVTYTKVK